MARSPFVQLQSLRDDEPVRARDLKAWADHVMKNRPCILQFGSAATGSTTRRMYPWTTSATGPTSGYPAVLIPFDGTIRNLCACNVDNTATDTDSWTATILKRSAGETSWTTTGVRATVAGNRSEAPAFGTGELKVKKGDLIALEVTYSGTITGIAGSMLASMELAAT